MWQLRVALRGSPFRVADAALLPGRGGAGAAAAVGREDLLLLLARYEPGVGNTLRVARVRRRELERAAAGTLLEPPRLAGRGGGEESAGVGEASGTQVEWPFERSGRGPPAAPQVEPEEVFTLSPRLHATENFEGLAAVASSDGVRLLLLSDNDYRRRTILLELLWPWPLRTAGETAAATPLVHRTGVHAMLVRSKNSRRGADAHFRDSVYAVCIMPAAATTIAATARSLYSIGHWSGAAAAHTETARRGSPRNMKIWSI